MKKWSTWEWRLTFHCDARDQARGRNTRWDWKLGPHFYKPARCFESSSVAWFPESQNWLLALNLHQLLWDLCKHSGKYANVAFPIQYKERCRGSQGMEFPSEHYHSAERHCSVAYGWRWVVFLVSSILTIKHIMRERERGIEFSCVTNA